jgi:site-specific DNA recombinase
VKDFVRKVVQRVVVHTDRIEVEVGKQKLSDILTADPHVSSVQRATEQLEQGSSAAIRLDIEARVRRCGGEMRLVFPPDHPGQAPALPASSLLKALTRGRQWYEWVVAGEVSGRRSIAQKLQLDERYVGRVLECAFSLPTSWKRSSMDANRLI